jgi:hypothetical protein
MTEIIIPDPLQGVAYFGVSKRILTNAPDHEETIRWAYEETQGFHASTDETTNALLIIERVIRDGLMEIRGRRVSLLTQVCLGLGLATGPIINHTPRALISTEEQLASDTMLAVFMARHCKVVYDAYGNPIHNPLAHYAKVRTGGNDNFRPVIANRHIESLIREHTDLHEQLDGYIKTRGVVPDSEEAVAAFHDYIATANTTPSLREAWL